MQWSSLTLLTPSFTIIPSVIIIITSVVFPLPFIFSQWVSQLELFHFCWRLLVGINVYRLYTLIQYDSVFLQLHAFTLYKLHHLQNQAFYLIFEHSKRVWTNKIRYYFLKIWYPWLMFGLLQYDYLFKGFNLFIWPFSHPSWSHIKSGNLHLRRLEVPLPNS